MEKKITYCIPSKNNLRYLVGAIRSIRQNSSLLYDIIVYVDQDNDGTINWLKENQIDYLVNSDSQPKGIAYAYNRCIENANTEVVCMFHADMFAGKGFDIGMFKFLEDNRKRIVSATRIEPPLHPSGMEKVIMDLGMYPEDFNEATFNLEVEDLIRSRQMRPTTNGIFAPWMCYRDTIMEIGMHDEAFHSYHEDSDIFNRFLLSGCELVQSWHSYVYHFTCRGGKYQDGVEQETQDIQFHEMKRNAAWNYIRKWGSWIENDEYQHPILTKKRNIALYIENPISSSDVNFILHKFEPFFSAIYLHNDTYENSGKAYIDMMQPHTKFDMRERIFPISKFVERSFNDVILEVPDLATLEKNGYIILNLQKMMESFDSNSIGLYEPFEGGKLTVNKVVDRSSELIFIDNQKYCQ